MTVESILANNPIGSPGPEGPTGPTGPAGAAGPAGPAGGALASANEVELTGTAAQTIATYTPSAAGAFLVGCRLRVTTATTVVTAQVTYTDATGAQTSTWLNAVPKAPGSYDLMPIVISSAAGSAITVSVTAGTANQVYAGAAIWGTASGSAIASYDTTVLTKLSLAPVAYWKLNDPVGSTTAADSSGNGYTLTVNGTVTFGKPSVVPSDSETSAQSDGTTGYLSAATFPALIPTGANPVTVLACASIPPSATLAIRELVFWGSAANNEGRQLGVGYPGAGNLFFSSYGNEAAANPPTADIPCLIGGGYDGENGFLYFNGGIVGTDSEGTAAITATALSVLAEGASSFTNFPIGRVAIFAGVLTPKDWRLLMQAFTGV